MNVFAGRTQIWFYDTEGSNWSVGNAETMGHRYGSRKNKYLVNHTFKHFFLSFLCGKKTLFLYFTNLLFQKMHIKISQNHNEVFSLFL